MKKTILAVDDEEDILELIRYNLEKAGYLVRTASSGEKGLEEIRRNPPDCIVLDLMLPGLDGLEVCRRLKQRPETRPIPVIMLTARNEDTDIVTGLELGADDYITKPFSPGVLVARIRTILRRVAGEEEESAVKPLRIHDILVDPVRHDVSVSGISVEFSASEFSILDLLARNPGRVFSRSRIIDSVKGKDYPVTERSVDVQILGIRKKLGEQGRHIETVRGVGYRMREE